MSDLHKFMRAYRINHNMTLTELSIRTGHHKSYWSRRESGQYQIRADDIEVWCEAVGMNDVGHFGLEWKYWKDNPY